MTSERKAVLKSNILLGLSFATFASILASAVYIGRIVERVDHTLASVVTVEDAKDWSAATMAANTNGWRSASWTAIFQANHGRRGTIQ